KATGVPLARIATRLIMGVPLSEMALAGFEPPARLSVKGVVLPFNKFPTLIPGLGPEMQSTGEAMGVGLTFQSALAKALLGAGSPTPADTLSTPSGPMLIEGRTV